MNIGNAFISYQATFFNDLISASNGSTFVTNPQGRTLPIPGATGISSTNPVSMCFLDQAVYLASGVSTVGVIYTPGFVSTSYNSTSTSTATLPTTSTISVSTSTAHSFGSTYTLDTSTSTAGATYSTASSTTISTWSTFMGSILQPETIVYYPGTPASTTVLNVIPTYCNLACTWRGRLCLAMDWNNPQNFYMSRLGVPTDFNYSATDPSAAVAGNLSVSGQIGEPITAMIPFSNDLAIFSSVNQIWLLEGDPADGGSMVRLSAGGGIIGPYAWCIDPDGILYYDTNAGLWSVAPLWSVYRPPELLTGQGWSFFFEQIDPSQNMVQLVWDTQNKYLHLYVTPTNQTTGTHLVYDFRNKGLWPQQYQFDVGPLASAGFISGLTSNTQSIVLGGQTGILYEEVPTATSDYNSPTSTQVAINVMATYSPFKFAPTGNFMITRLETDCGEWPASIQGVSTIIGASTQWEDDAGNTEGQGDPNGFLVGAVNSTNTAFSTNFPVAASTFLGAWFIDTTGNEWSDTPTLNGGTSITTTYPIISIGRVSPGVSTVGYIIQYAVFSPSSTVPVSPWNMDVVVRGGGTAANVSDDGYSYPTLDSTSNSTAYLTWSSNYTLDGRQQLEYPRLMGPWFSVTVGNPVNPVVGGYFSLEQLTLTGSPMGLNRARR